MEPILFIVFFLAGIGVIKVIQTEHKDHDRERECLEKFETIEGYDECIRK